MGFKIRNKSGGPLGIVGKIGSTLFLGIFLAAGLFFLFLLGSVCLKVLATYTWKETPATIVQSKLVENPKTEDPYSFEIKYSYQWEGRTFTSSKYSDAKASYGNYDTAQEKLTSLPAGEKTVCYVNPKNPEEVVLRRDAPWLVFFLIIPIVFICVGGGGIIGIWRADKAPSQSGSASTVAKKGGRVFPLLFGLIFAGVGAALTIFWIIPSINRAIASKSWDKTPCTVVSSRVKSHSGKSTTYSVDILYRYEVAGKEYKSNRYNSMGGSSSGRDGKQKVVARYPAGSKAVCYVNPKNPQESVLEPGLGWWGFLALIPLLFFAVGVFIIIITLKSPSVSTVSASPAAAYPRSPGGPVALKSTSPLGKLAGIVFIALFWNGIVSVFLFQVVKGFQRGHPEWFLTIFLIPFVLIGLTLIGAIGYFALAFFNPRCRLQVDSAVVEPGKTFAISWEFRGSVSRMSQLLIYLEGREESTYRRGTSTTTDREVFARIPIVEVASWMEMGQGTAQCFIPAKVMPSFASTNNKIIWTLKVRGEIARWPDVNDEFPIIIAPAASGGIS